MKYFLLLTACVLLGACSHTGKTHEPQPLQDLAVTVDAAMRSADSGKYDAADKRLVEFAKRNEGSREAGEVQFWRALLRIDPNNRGGSLGAGITAMDAYLADTANRIYRNEAVIIRRTAGLAHSLRSAAAAAPSPEVKDNKDAAAKSRDEENAALREQLSKTKEELAKVNAELERIKKRLADPKG